MLKKIRKADIPKAEREIFERFGETSIADTLARGGYAPRNPELQVLYASDEKCRNAAKWLTERADIKSQHETMTFYVEVAVLIFVVMSVVEEAVLILTSSFPLPLPWPLPCPTRCRAATCDQSSNGHGHVYGKRRARRLLGVPVSGPRSKSRYSSFDGPLPFSRGAFPRGVRLSPTRPARGRRRP